MIRAPICTVVGHVDHGKTTLLDRIRGTAVAAGEAGAITQAIGASIIPIEHIKERGGQQLADKDLSIPGLLFIDTPGHAAFTGMRKRGGGLADIAVLIVDLNEGFKPQTREAVEILKNHKTPFIIAANKLDRAPGYKHKHDDIIKDIEAQSDRTVQYIETKVYELVGTLGEYGMNADRFDRVKNFTQQVGVVPISALEGYGINSLLLVLVGLAQRYLEEHLDATPDGPAKGTVLEVSEEQGMGLTLNAIIYDGKLDVGDTIVIGTLGTPVVTKVRALFQPANVGDIRDQKTEFRSVEKAVAATGVKISAPDLEGVSAGMPLEEATGRVQEVSAQIEKEIDAVQIQTQDAGVVVKADNIGSLEAVITMLREKAVPISHASVGPVTKKDVTRAAASEDEHAVVLAFNTETAPEVTVPEGVRVIEAKIIYELIDRYQEHRRRVERARQEETVESLPRPARLEVLQNCIFRQSNPLICGVDVRKGTLSVGTRLIKEDNPSETVGYVKEIQDEGENLQEASEGMQIAVSVPGATGGRQVLEGDVLWAAIGEDEYRQLKDHAKRLSAKEKDVLKEFADVMRKNNPVWGI